MDSLMKPTTNSNSMPLDIVGSTGFGRYPKISVENTFNMIISDNFLVPYAGYKLVQSISPDGVGRAIFSSTRLGKMIVVIDNKVFVVSANLSFSQVGTINTFVGDVFIDENIADQIAICDKQSIYIYTWSTGAFVQATLDGTTPLDFQPGYVTYQDGYFISPNISTVVGNQATWRLSMTGDGTQWPPDSQHSGSLQTKSDYAVATLRIPGNGGLLFVFGKTVTELWYDVGAQLFPYVRSTSFSIDYGCLSSSTIAASDTMVAWLASNEKSGPCIVFSQGGPIQQISTDGINFRLSHLTAPQESYAFFLKQDGHLFYQITFTNPDDNLTLTYDFNTQKFFTLTDENMNRHIAKRVCFFNNAYYFVSLVDGNIYELNSEFTNYEYGKNANNDDIFYEIPRIRICKSVRLPDSSRFIVNNLTFTLEQGTDPNNYNNFTYTPRVDLTVSKDGGETFGSTVSKNINPIGIRKNRLIFWNLGAANDFTPQFRFWGFGRFVATDGLTSMYQ